MMTNSTDIEIIITKYNRDRTFLIIFHGTPDVAGVYLGNYFVIPLAMTIFGVSCCHGGLAHFAASQSA